MVRSCTWLNHPAQASCAPRPPSGPTATARFVWFQPTCACLWPQRYFGTAVGKGRQAAKTEIERLKLDDMTCQQGVLEVAKMCAMALLQASAVSPSQATFRFNKFVAGANAQLCSRAFCNSLLAMVLLLL